MALDWLPIDAPRPPRRPRRRSPTTEVSFTAAAVPVTDVLADLTFLPVTDLRRSHRRRVSPPEVLSPFTDALRPLAWLPLSLLRRRPLPRRPRIDTIEPPPSVQVVIAQQLGWLPTVTDRLPRHRPSAAGAVYETPPSVIAATILCTELADDALTSTDQISTVVRSTDLIAEAVMATALTDESVC